MSQIDYSRTVIYKISCNNPAVSYVFVGSTVDFAKMKYQHRRKLADGNTHELYETIRANGGIDNWKMTVLQSYTACKSKIDAAVRVNEFEEQLRLQNPPMFARPPSETLRRTSETLQQNEENERKPSNNLQLETPCFSHCSASQSQELHDINLHGCKYCNRTFTRKDNLSRHMRYRCSENKYIELEKENEELKKQLLDTQEQIVKLNESVTINPQTDTTCKSMTTTNNMNTNTNSNATTNSHNSHNTITNTVNTNNTNNTNNTVNNTNNNFNIMSFGTEDFSKIFGNNKNNRLKVLRQKHSALQYRIQHSRCSKKHPELRNVVITNLRSDVAHVYRETVDPDNFIVMSAADVLDLIVSNDYAQIETDFEQLGHELDDKTREHTGEFIRQMNENPSKMKEQKQNIKRMIYNMNRDIKIKDVRCKKDTIACK